MNQTIAENIQQVRNRIKNACFKAQRNEESVALLAVSKTHGVEKIQQAYAAGLTSFGENYAQEGVSKILALDDIRPNLTWHFIGPLQSNKARMVAEHFDVIQTVDRVKIAQKLSDYRPQEFKPLEVLIQVNVSGEQSKSGVRDEGELMDLIHAIHELPQLAFKGLMAIPEVLVKDAEVNATQAGSSYKWFQDLGKVLEEKLQPKFQGPIIRSIGMSDDLEEAILHGSTMVRIGSSIFGKRQ